MFSESMTLAVAAILKPIGVTECLSVKSQRLGSSRTFDVLEGGLEILPVH